MMVSTTNDIAGYRTVRHLGLVRGITVRSRSVVGNFLGGVQAIFGGKIGAYVKLAEAARQEAFDHLCEDAAQGGANAVIGMRYGRQRDHGRHHGGARLWNGGLGRADLIHVRGRRDRLGHAQPKDGVDLRRRCRPALPRCPRYG